MAGTLFVVATPIGNLEDITLRALRVLREVDLIAAEDTRRTNRLLSHYAIQTRLVSLHEHNERARVPHILATLAEGRSVALVTDAGTPGASDPGMPLVRAARQAGLRVESVPGPSAITAALSVAGEAFDSFVFLGFPPTRSKDRKQWLADLAAASRPVVLFEAPHRIRRTLEELGPVLVNRPITLCRELTKIHEEVISGTAQELLAHLTEPRGEFTLVIAGRTTADSADQVEPGGVTDERIHYEFGQITESFPRLSRREQLRLVGERLGMRTGEVYEALERAKHRSNNQ